MNKLKLLIRGGMDGATLVTAVPEFSQIEGWTQAVIGAPSGVLPAGLWGKVPAADPYMLHVSVLATKGLQTSDFFELQSGEPVQPRAQYVPTPGNARIVLVRPTDRLRFKIEAQVDVRIELLIESIGGVNELGSRLFDWASGEQNAQRARSLIARYSGAGTIPAWGQDLHVVYDGGLAGNLQLPPRTLVPVGSVLTVTRRAAGVPTLVATGGDTILSAPVASVTRSAIVYNNGDEWTFAGE